MSLSKLTEIASIGDYGWEWSLFELHRHEDGRLFYLSGGGCSCNDLWDRVDDLDDLEELTPGTWDQFETAVKEFTTYGSDGDEAVHKTEMLKIAALELAKRE